MQHVNKAVLVYGQQGLFWKQLLRESNQVKVIIFVNVTCLLLFTKDQAYVYNELSKNKRHKKPPLAHPT